MKLGKRKTPPEVILLSSDDEEGGPVRPSTAPPPPPLTEEDDDSEDSAQMRRAMAASMGFGGGIDGAGASGSGTGSRREGVGGPAWRSFSGRSWIIIPSANASPGDWSRLDNAFWIQDFPSHSPSPSISKPRLDPTHTSYSLPFLDYLAHLRCSKPFLSPFLNYYFSSATPGVQLVETRSSIDTYTPAWLAQFYAACCGIHPRTCFSSSSTTAPNLPSPLPLKFVLPTVDEVIASHGSYAGASNTFCSSKNWTANKLYQRLLHKITSKRPGVIPHTKQIVALRKPSSQTLGGFKYEGYVYIGSHNPTRAAWGRLDTGAKGVPTPLNSNYKLGVLIPVRGDSEAEVERKVGELATFPRPLVPYASGDVPWMQERFQKEIYGQW